MPTETLARVGGSLATIATVTLPVETFTDEEQARLAPHFTNLDRPVFGLVNLPETVKGALFARYSRYAGTLRRLFLDEFADSVPEVPAIEGNEGERAAALYERIFLGYGDDSVAQLGGAHIACEWTSNLLTKILQRPRLASYLEQSTRYIAYDSRLDGFGYRYYRDPRFGPQYEQAMDDLFQTYTGLLEGMSAWAAEQFPRGEDESAAAHARAVRAKALDLVRGILPAASLSHMGIYASGQTYEQLVLHLLAHPLAEAQAYGQMLLEELQKIIPSFVVRVPKPDRGGRWIQFFEERRAAAEGAAARLGLDAAEPAAAPSVRLIRAHGTETQLAAALLYEASATGRGGRAARGRLALRRRARVAPARADRHAREPAPPAGPRLRDAPLPLRDRLRLRRVPRPAAAPPAHVPVAAALARSRRRRAARARRSPVWRASTSARSTSRARRTSGCAPTASPRKRRTRSASRFRIRYVLELDAREALHLIELRSGRRAIRRTARSRTRCAARSPRCTRTSPPR